MKKMITRLMIALCSLGLYTPILHAADRSFEVYGFGQVDYIQDFKRVDPDWAATMRASKIPTTEGQFGEDGQALISARQSRLGAKGLLPTANGDVFGRVEFDFFGVGADAGQTTIRFRHGYGEWNGILGGQTNSLFMDDDMWPNIVDYWGPSGMVFLRNPQVRWTPVTGERTFAVAIEHPSNDIDIGQLRQIDTTGLAGGITSVSKVPDFTARFRQNIKPGYVQLAGILRRLGYDSPGTPGGPHGSDLGWGLDLTSTINLRGKNKILLSGVYGAGIANYMNDGGMDLAAERDSSSPSGATGVAVPLFGLMAYYDHWWSDKFSSSFGYGRTQVENTDLQNASAYHSGEYASTNLIYYPTESVFFGAEYLWGQRRDSGGAKGIDNRIQLSANYKFSSGNLFAR